MHIETERKFLVRNLEFKEEAKECLHMEQGYISRSEGKTVRVRISGAQAFLTIKGPSANGISRLEWEKEITVDDAEDLMQLCCGGTIIKDRYIIPAGNGRFFEVDEFFGDNAGLVVAEIELGEEDESFIHPAWLGKEVTGDRRYYNSELTAHPFKEW